MTILKHVRVIIGRNLNYRSEIDAPPVGGARGSETDHYAEEIASSELILT